MNPLLLEYFGLRDQPFAVTPDPRYLYESETHREALASLMYGISSDRGFLALIGKPGMGKTTLLFRLLEQYRHRALTAFLFQTQCEWREFLSYLFADLGIQCEDANDLVTMHQRLNRILGEQARKGRFCLVVIDEAQNLDSRALETVRLLSDFETSRTKLLQIVLAGQPAFEDRLAEESMLQLRQRLSMVCRLSPLGQREVNEYIDHRLRIAGHKGTDLFTADARERIAQLSEGIPRVISNICFNSMSLAFATGRREITPELVNEVGADLSIQRSTSEPSGPSATVQGASSSGRTGDAADGIRVRQRPPDPDPTTAAVADRAPMAAPGSNSRPTQSTATIPGPGGAAAVTARHPVAAARNSGKETYGRGHGRRRRHPAFRVVERTIVGMAVAAGVVALVIWLFAHQIFGGALPSAPDGPGVQQTGSLVPALEQPARRAQQPQGISQNARVNGMKSAPDQTSSSRTRHSSVRSGDNGSERVSDMADTATPGGRVHFPAPPSKSGYAPQSPPGNLSALNPTTTAVLAHTPAIAVKPPAPAFRTSSAAPETLPGTVAKVVKPDYPESARAASIEGVVTLQALVDTEGLVKQVRVLDGSPALTNAAVQAVKHWQYRPYRQDGVPVVFQTIIRIRFVLDENSPRS